MATVIELLRDATGWLFLVVAVVGALATLNAFWPVRRNRLLLLPSFLAGTLTVELAGFALMGHAALTGGFVLVGALTHTVGWVALGLTGASALASLILVVEGAAATTTMRTTLRPLLGHTPRLGGGRWRLLVPFPLRGMTGRVTRNVVYARHGGQRQRLDIYHPRQTTPRRPAVIHVHGGGWTVGDKREQGVPLMAVLADRGFVGFNVNYRRSPGATWPEHLIDIKRAIAWVREHADAYGVDPASLAIAGGSAGGHLAAMVALTANDPEYQPGFEDADTRVSAAAPFYAIYDLTDAHQRHAPGFIDLLLQPVVIKAFLDDDRPRFVAASPLHRVHAEAPPFLVVHGDRDSLAPLDDARDFVAALRRVSKQSVLFAEIRGAQHSFDFFISPRSLPVLEGVAVFFEHVLAPAGLQTSRETSG